MLWNIKTRAKNVTNAHFLRQKRKDGLKMKVKYGCVAIAAGSAVMLGGLALKNHCEKCGCTLFGFGLAHVFLGSLSLLKGENGCIPDKVSIPIPKCDLEIDLE